MWQSRTELRPRGADSAPRPRCSNGRCPVAPLLQRRIRASRRTRRAAVAFTEQETRTVEIAEIPWKWKEGFRDSYQLGKNIGRGSYGVVHLCYNEAKEKLAVKILPKVRAKQAPERTLRKLQKEVALMGRVARETAGVTQLVEVFQDAQYVYIVMGLNEGGDLEGILERHGAFSERAAATVVYECLKIISCCHSNGVLLGDIKPANFMLAARKRDPLRAIESGALGAATGWLRAVDFGCSQAVTERPLCRRTGTPVYMSPETFRREYHLEADMWSLGMMLYQLIASRFPFWPTMAQCRTRSLEEVMKAVIMEDIPLDYGPWLAMSPEGLHFLQRLLQRDPAQRASALEALEHPWFARHLSGGAQQPEPGQAAAAGGARLPHQNNIVPLDAGGGAAPRCCFYTSAAASVLRTRSGV